MNRATGALLRCTKIPSNRCFIPERSWPATRSWSGYRSFRARHLHSTFQHRASDSPNSAAKIDEAELARLLEQFEGTDSKRNAASGAVNQNATLAGPLSSVRVKRKSKIEDYDAWHGWDGESDTGPHHNTPSGVNEVDRYISDVLSDVAKSKATAQRAKQEVKAVQKDVSDCEDGVTETDARKDGKRDISFDGKITGTLGIPELASSSRPSHPEGNGDSAKISQGAETKAELSKRPTFSKADVAALTKKLQSRLDEEIRRLKTQKEVVKRLLSTRAREFGKDAQVQFGLLGGKVNEVTGYNEIERLKQDVRERG